VGVALRCTRCGATSVSSLFYLGTDAHVCRICNAPFELADPGRDRRRGRDRRTRGNGVDGWAEWRSGADRRGNPDLKPRCKACFTGARHL
jgi:hypothetical protein